VLTIPTTAYAQANEGFLSPPTAMRTRCEKTSAVISACCICRSGLYLRNYYGSGSGPIWFSYLYCTGNELTIAGCGHGGWGEHIDICGRRRRHDVSIICDSCKCWQ